MAASNRQPRKKKVRTLPKRFFVYIVRCSDGTFYTGIADDVSRRINEHNGVGKVGAKYTRARRPVILVYTEQKKNRSTALKREYAIKQLSRAGKQMLIRSKKDT